MQLAFTIINAYFTKTLQTKNEKIRIHRDIIAHLPQNIFILSSIHNFKFLQSTYIEETPEIAFLELVLPICWLINSMQSNYIMMS